MRIDARVRRLWQPPWLFALVLTLAALAVRLGYNALTAGPAYLPELDAAEYSDIAFSLATGRGFALADGTPTAIRPPLYPLLLAGVYVVRGGADPWWGLIQQALVGAVGAAAVYALGRLAFGQVAGRLAGALAACYPLLVFAGGALLSEPTFILLVTLVMASALWQLDRPRLSRYLLTGVLLGLAWLARPTGMVLVPFVVGWWLMAGPRPPRQRLGGGIVIGLAALFVAAPWMARNYRVFDTFIPSSTMGGAVLFGSNNDVVLNDVALHGDWVSPCLVPGAGWTCALGEVARDAAWRDLGLAFMREHMAELPQMVGWRLIKFWHLYPFTHGFPTNLGFYAYVAVAILAVAGAWFQRRRWREVSLLLAVILCFAAGSLVFWGGFRMRMPIEPALIVLAAGALGAIYRFLQNHHMRPV
jgi:4-amino-4-deoxy-L-arabinose transferase-like glycosyltransferase